MMGHEQMTHDGISRIRAWSKPIRTGFGSYTYSVAIPRPTCGNPSCAKRAGYNTPNGPRCFTHAIAASSLVEAE